MRRPHVAAGAILSPLAENGEMDAQLLDMVAKGGIVGICLLTIWLGWKREERSALSFEKLNERNQEVHVKTIAQLSELNANSRALHDEIRQRPCVNDQWSGHERRKT